MHCPQPSAGEQLLQERDKLLAEVKPYLGANQRFEPPCAAEYAKKVWFPTPALSLYLLCLPGLRFELKFGSRSWRCR
jgi:hypothetical protein